MDGFSIIFAVRAISIYCIIIVDGIDDGLTKIVQGLVSVFIIFIFTHIF